MVGMRHAGRTETVSRNMAKLTWSRLDSPSHDCGMSVFVVLFLFVLLPMDGVSVSRQVLSGMDLSAYGN